MSARARNGAFTALIAVWHALRLCEGRGVDRDGPKPFAKPQGVPPRISLWRIRRVEVLREKSIRLQPRFPCRLRVETVELMTARRVLVDLVLERLARRLERLDQVLDL